MDAAITEAIKVKVKFLTASSYKNTVFANFVTDRAEYFTLIYENNDISLNVFAGNQLLIDRIESAIREGETDENQDIELYLSIREQFTINEANELLEQNNGN